MADLAHVTVEVRFAWWVKPALRLAAVTHFLTGWPSLEQAGSLIGRGMKLGEPEWQEK